MQVNERSALDIIVLLPQTGCTSGEEMERAAELLRDAGIPVIVYEYFEDHALLWIEALDCDEAVLFLTAHGLNAGRPN